MNEFFVKSLYDSIVKENLQLYKELYETTVVTPNTDDDWQEAIEHYRCLPDEKKGVLLKIIEQTMIDTISNMLSVIDGNSTLEDRSLELNLLMNSISIEGELQDLFLEFVEEEGNNE